MADLTRSSSGMNEKVMHFSQALDRTLNEYGIKAKWLAERSGVSPQMISDFRNGKQRIYSDSLEKMLASLPAEAREYFFRQLGSSPATIETRIAEMNNVELSTLLLAIADKLQTSKAPARALISA
jgi:transcriptional regulator with XRE-family HTH domain